MQQASKKLVIANAKSKNKMLLFIVAHNPVSIKKRNEIMNIKFAIYLSLLYLKIHFHFFSIFPTLLIHCPLMILMFAYRMLLCALQPFHLQTIL